MKNTSLKISALTVSLLGFMSFAYANDLNVNFDSVASGKSTEQRIDAQQNPNAASTIQCNILSNAPKIATGQSTIWLKSDQGSTNRVGALDKNNDTSAEFTLNANSIPGSVYLDTTPDLVLENNAASTSVQCTVKNVAPTAAGAYTTAPAAPGTYPTEPAAPPAAPIAPTQDNMGQ